MDIKIAEIGTRLTDIEKKQVEHDKRIRKLEKEDYNVQKVSETLQYLQEYGRRNTIELHGIPQDEGENLFEIIKDIGKVLNVNVTDNHIDATHRLNYASGVNPVIVKFANRWVCDMIKSSRRKKKIFANNIGFEDSQSRIYINVSLTKATSYLAMKTRKEFKRRNCAVWVDDGANIWVKKIYESQQEADLHKNEKFKIVSEEQFVPLLQQLDLF